MKPYEAIIIFKSEMTEDKISAAASKIEKKIMDSGGTDISVTKWGMRRLAFPIKKAKNAGEGHYILINFNSEGITPNELKSLLNVSEDVIRYSVICSKPKEKEVKEETVEIEPSMIAGEAEQVK